MKRATLLLFVTCASYTCASYALERNDTVQASILRTAQPTATNNAFIFKMFTLCSPWPCWQQPLCDNIDVAVMSTFERYMESVRPVVSIADYSSKPITIDDVEMIFPMYAPPQNILSKFFVSIVVVQITNISSEIEDYAVFRVIRQVQTTLYEGQDIINVISSTHHTRPVTTTRSMNNWYYYLFNSESTDDTKDDRSSMFDNIPIVLYHVIFVLFWITVVLIVFAMVMSCIMRPVQKVPRYAETGYAQTGYIPPASAPMGVETAKVAHSVSTDKNTEYCFTRDDATRKPTNPIMLNIQNEKKINLKLFG